MSAPAIPAHIQGNEDVVTLNTKFGDIVLILHDRTPKHKANFLKLAKEGFYDGTTFHRVIDNFMIQGGDVNSKDSDPNNDGQGSLNYLIDAEFDPALTHIQGAVAAARMGDQVNPEKKSSACQFYIVEPAQGVSFLDKNYTVFGQVLKGIDIVEKIAVVQKDPRDRPLEDVKMTVKVETMPRTKVYETYGYAFPFLAQ